VLALPVACRFAYPASICPPCQLPTQPLHVVKLLLPLLHKCLPQALSLLFLLLKYSPRLLSLGVYIAHLFFFFQIIYAVLFAVVLFYLLIQFPANIAPLLPFFTSLPALSPVQILVQYPPSAA
jgi:hypothetical protein